MTIDIDDVNQKWQRQWHQSEPIAEAFRHLYADRWVRFHALPDSKRYPDNDAELATILGRHNGLLTELNPRESLIVITCDWSETSSPWPDKESERAKLTRALFIDGPSKRKVPMLTS